MSSFFVYITRITPALSVFGLLILLLFSLVIDPRKALSADDVAATSSQLLLSFYILVLHLLSVAFPARLCWAIRDVTYKMKQAANEAKKPTRRKNRTRKGADPVFVIIIPAYKETFETLQETLRVLSSHRYASWSYHIYLAMEEREEGSACKAGSLARVFKKSFYKMSYTFHPDDIAGEAQGKSSNESWAARQAFRDYPDRSKQNVIITIMDADTHLPDRYFAQVRYHHVDDPHANQETIYVPPLVFDRNIQTVPLMVRTADLIWAGAGISSLHTVCTVRIPTSVYSLPMTLAESVDGWDTGPGAIGEDMHMYIKCFFALSGRLNAKVIYAAASQCNVSSDENGLRGYVDGIKARYRQALRHMWGAMDSGYAIRQAFAMVCRHLQANKSILGGSLTVSELMLQTEDAILAILSLIYDSNLDSFRSSSAARNRSAKAALLRPMNVLNVLTLFLRLFEAHFLPIHLAITMTATTAYGCFSRSVIPYELALALNVCGYCRLASWILVCLYFLRYAAYHRLCIDLRQKDMKKAELLENGHEHEGYSGKIFGTLGFLEPTTFLLGGFLFGPIPACQAAFSHLFTDRLTYHVSKKPQLGQSSEEKSRSLNEEKQT